MNESILSVLAFVRKTLPVSLIDGKGYARLAVVAGMLPAQLTTFYGLECRLGRPEALGDVAFEIKNASQGQRLLAGRIASVVDEICEQWPIWQRLRTFATDWAEPDHPFHEHIRNIWLEFDTATTESGEKSSPERIRQPCVFFSPDAKSVGKERLLNVILDTVAALGGTSGQISETLRAFLASLPDSARLFQVGLMLSRGNHRLRVCVNHLDYEVMPDWLSGLGWQGGTQALAALLQRVTPLVHSTALGLTLTEAGPADKIGLECYQDLLEEDPKQWIPLLDFLDELDLCVPQKRQGLLDFPGISRSPAKQRKSSDGILYLNTFRKIHHLKLNISTDQIVEAKAYLSLRRPGIRIGELFAEFTSPTGPKSSEDAWLIE